MTVTSVTAGALIDPAWGNSVADALNDQTDRMSILLSKTVGQTIATSTQTAVTWDVETGDVGGLHPSSTRITIPTGGSGLWQLGYSVSFDSNGTGDREVHIRRNGGVGSYFAYSTAWMQSSGFWAMSGTQLLPAALTADGDYFEVFVFQSSGGNLGLRGNNTVAYLSNFWAVRLGD